MEAGIYSPLVWSPKEEKGSPVAAGRLGVPQLQGLQRKGTCVRTQLGLVVTQFDLDANEMHCKRTFCGEIWKAEFVY